MTIDTMLDKALQGDATAKGELRARAQNGEADALWALGEMYAAGQGLPLKPDKAAECFRRAAEQAAVAEKFAAENLSAFNAAQNGYVDGIVEETELRGAIISALEMLAGKRVPTVAKKHNTV